ncbi:hypothetical protein CISIN_1g0468602mg, partial [Citrus sinensis]
SMCCRFSLASLVFLDG